jgi:hypothetical protein
MKMKSQKILLLALATVCGWMAPAVGQVTFNISQTSVSNTYLGTITLQVGGLNTGEQVVFQDYLDLNGNGVVDAGEPLINAFRITDGGATVIGGITNISVPYDSNPAAGAITTTLNFAATLDNLTGQRIFKIASPTNRFTATNVIFNVTNSTLAQSVSGTVLVSGSVPVAHAVVVALLFPSQNYTVATVADGTGHYSLPLSPGSYFLIAGSPNTYSDQGAAPVVTLTPGHSSTANLFLTNGTVALGGTVVDSGNSNALGGVFLQLESGNLFAIAFTDTNGNFGTMVTPGMWKVKGDSSSMGRRGYVVPQGGIKVDTSGGAVTNAVLSLTRGNALFYGSALSPTGTPLINFHISANTDSSAAKPFKSEVYTVQNGNYGAPALVTSANTGDTNAWNCSPGSNPAFSSLLITQGLDTALVSNQTVQLNFRTLAGTATIFGRLHDTSNNPVAGVNVSGNTIINTTNFSSLGSDTDANGNYSFAASDTQWQVSVDCCDSSGLDNFGLYDPVPHNFFVSTSARLDITAYPDNTPVLYNPQSFNSCIFGFNVSAPVNPPGNHYVIRETTNLNLPVSNWTTILITNLNGFSTFTSDTNATNRGRFYNVSVGP